MSSDMPAVVKLKERVDAYIEESITGDRERVEYVMARENLEESLRSLESSLDVEKLCKKNSHGKYGINMLCKALHTLLSHCVSAPDALYKVAVTILEDLVTQAADSDSQAKFSAAIVDHDVVTALCVPPSALSVTGTEPLGLAADLLSLVMDPAPLHPFAPGIVDAMMSHVQQATVTEAYDVLDALLTATTQFIDHESATNTLSILTKALHDHIVAAETELAAIDDVHACLSNIAHFAAFIDQPALTSTITHVRSGSAQHGYGPLVRALDVIASVQPDLSSAIVVADGLGPVSAVIQAGDAEYAVGLLATLLHYTTGTEYGRVMAALMAKDATLLQSTMAEYARIDKAIVDAGLDCDDDDETDEAASGDAALARLELGEQTMQAAGYIIVHCRADPNFKSVVTSQFVAATGRSFGVIGAAAREWLADKDDGKEMMDALVKRTIRK